ncbi:hypothetical protein RBA41_29580 [Massilia sp. CCM 9210]|uniref:hypothetical protein n=1 Tax=Massilia scottii TaxID=3057166 RepID=UPI002796DDB0|nr:hypothetical protein [Massilia sp. CCM 9210]MDQ1817464.1 hypothetical protein [Massilia sp. CCM 9210]
MKLLLAIFLILPIASSMAGECLKVEYQEMKEWSEDQLLKKFCEDKKDFANHEAVASFNEKIAGTYKTMGDTQGASRSWEKWSAASDSAKICKNEMDRAARILSQKNIDEASIKARCP